MDKAFTLKPNMLLGTASTATQIDGGALDHTWNRWYAEGHIRDGSSPAVAAHHWERWWGDVMLLRRLGVQTYRLGVEWARMEPAEGFFDEKAIARFKEEILLLIGMGIAPLVTFQRFTNPLWFEKKGGWANYENIRLFLLFVEKMVRSLGHLVSEYITFDEANVYAVNGYMTGAWPPGLRKTGLAMRVMSNMATAHIKAYRLIHDMRRSMGFRNTKVSFAGRMQVFTPKDPKSLLHRRTAEEGDRLFQTQLIVAMATGEFKRPLKNQGGDRRGAYCDFHALNYYGRCTVGAGGAAADAGGMKNDLGWEIYPEGIVECCQRLYAMAPLPIYITANGTCDIADSFRARFLYEHLRQLCQTKLPVKRYYYNCFLDGFEWLEGGYAKFGLVSIHPETMERSVKTSGKFFSAIIQRGGVTQALYDEYVDGQAYHY